MRVALDSNGLTYFLQANRGGDDPDGNPDAELANQRKALLLLWLYTDNPVIVPTVARENQGIRDDEKRREHHRWTELHLHEVIEKWLDADQITARATELEAFHRKPSDCRIVAECEGVKSVTIDALATFDRTLLRKLRERSRVPIATPDECWRRAAVAPGTTPQVTLKPEHPLFGVPWLQV